MSESNLEPVTVTDGDRTLSGVGVTTEQLEKTMERHAPDVPVASSEPRPDTAKVSRGQQRFSQLTSERDKALNEAKETARERDELKQRIAALDSQRIASPGTPDVPSPHRSVPASGEGAGGSDRSSAVSRPKPTEAEIGTKYETYPDFIEDLADWKAEQRLAAQDFDARIRQSIEADRTSRTLADKVDQKIAKARQTFSDFDATIRNAPHMVAADWPQHLVNAIVNHDDSESIRYALAKNPDLSARLKTLDPVSAGIELAKLITPASAVALPASTASAGTVTPPPPFQPVGAGSKTTVPPLADLPQKAGYDFDKSGYRERRAAERGVTRRR